MKPGYIEELLDRMDAGEEPTRYDAATLLYLIDKLMDALADALVARDEARKKIPEDALHEFKGFRKAVGRET